MTELSTSYALSLIPIVAKAIELVGIFVIVIGGIWASALYFKEISRSTPKAYENYRRNLGRAILLGLEFLVAGDIVGTIAVEPTFRNLGILALIVLIRTFLSLSLEIEIVGRLPWRKQTN